MAHAHVRWLLAFELCAALAIVGMVLTRRDCRADIAATGLQYGFRERPPVADSTRAWNAIGACAAVWTVPHKPVFSFEYRALNDRAALHGEQLRVYINDKLEATLWLTSSTPAKAWCAANVTTGKIASIRFVASRTFVPLKEHWFNDPREYGALVTPLVWRAGGQAPTPR